MTESTGAAAPLRTLWERIDAQDWERLLPLLDPDFRARLLHTGEEFDATGFVQLNRDYPGRWRGSIEDLIADGDRAVSRCLISDGRETYHVASFATVRSGRITELVELWTESEQAPPESRRPSPSG